MKNKKIIEAYNKIEITEARQQKMLEAVLDKVDRPKAVRNGLLNGNKWLHLASLVAMAAMAVIILANPGLSAPKKADISDDLNKAEVSECLYCDEENEAKVYYVDWAPASSTTTDLQPLSEKELLLNAKTIIVEATIVEVRNFAIDFAGYQTYNAVATIEVTEVLRGDVKKGEHLSLIVGTPLDFQNNYYVEDHETVALMKNGLSGIFILAKYDSQDSWQYGNARFYYNKMADYYFLDGVRYLFLQSPHGLSFARFAYPGLKTAGNLQDVKAYIVKIMESE